MNCLIISLGYSVAWTVEGRSIIGAASTSRIMPANHSKLSGVAARVVCGCAVLPLKGSRDNACRGPAPTAGDDEADIVDEVRVCRGERGRAGRLDV